MYELTWSHFKKKSLYFNTRVSSFFFKDDFISCRGVTYFSNIVNIQNAFLKTLEHFLINNPQ